MITLAAVAAKEAAFMTSAGVGLFGIAPGAVDGFAVGALAMGTCCLAFAVARLLRRVPRPASYGMWGTGLRRPRAKRDYYAEPGDSAADQPVSDMHRDLAETFAPEAEVLAREGSELHAAPVSNWLADLAPLPPFEASEDWDSLLLGTTHDQPGHDQTGRPGRSRKHRSSWPESYRQAEARRLGPRHAAPSVGLLTRMSGRSAAVPLAVRG